jgi:hypothetical protein
MTSNEFVIWLKGFTEGVHEFNVTPKQWDYLKEKLAEVDTAQTLSSTSLTIDYSKYNPSYTSYSAMQSGSWHYTNEIEEKIF